MAPPICAPYEAPDTRSFDGFTEEAHCLMKQVMMSACSSLEGFGFLSLLSRHS